MLPIARRNLLAEPGRFAISVLGVAIAILLILIVLALYRGWSRTGSILEEMPGELWIAQRGTVDPFHSISLLTEDQLVGVGRVEGVAGTVKVLARRMAVQTPGGEMSVYVLALESPGGADVDEELKAFFPPRGEVRIDSLLQRKSGIEEGSPLVIGQTSVVVGPISANQQEAFVQFVFAHFDDAAAMFGIEKTVNFQLVSITEGADAAAIMQQIEALDPRLQVFTSGDFAHSVRKEIDNTFLPIIGILTVIGFAVGAAVVGLTIYTATVERIREFGVMKAVGASASYLYRIVFTQSLILTASGFVLGVGSALLVARAAESGVPDFTTEFRLADLSAVFLLASLMAVLASFIPIRRVLGVDPASVFRP